MDLPGSSTDYQSSLSALSTPIFSDNVLDVLGSTSRTSPSAIFTVNSTADVVDDSDGVTTLREAINSANANAGDSLIVFDRSVFSTAQTITLNLGELDITHNTSIIAPQDSLTGANLVEVSGKASRVIEIETGATVTLSGLIVANGGGLGVENGGGIRNRGTLTLDNSIVRNNGSYGMHGIKYGAGIYNDNGASLTVNNSTISNNNASFAGGGIYNSNDSIVLLSNCDLNNNSAYYDVGGALFNRGTMNVSNSTINNNLVTAGGGGGIGNNGIMTVSNSTLYGNSAYIGGGIYSSGGIMTVSNSTLSGNKASYMGGAIFNSKYNNSSAYLTLVFSTVTLNSGTDGGSVYNENSIPVYLRNTIIAANLLTKSGINPDVFGLFSSNGYNLIGDSTGSTGFDQAKGDIVGTTDNPIDPRLAPLDFYGGSTQTIALLPDSPAIDAGDPTVLDTDPITDQRGYPRVSGARADIGAFEFYQGAIKNLGKFGH